MIRKITILLFFTLTILAGSRAQQVIYFQNFEDTTNLLSNFVQANLDKGNPAGTDWDTLQQVAWFVDKAGEIVTTSGFITNHAAVGTSNYDPATEANDWLITPSIRLGEESVLEFSTFSFVSGASDIIEIYVSTTEQSVSGCLFNGPVAEFTSTTPDILVKHTLDLSTKGFKNQMVYIGFRLKTASGGDRTAIDNISVTENVTHFAELTFTVNMSNYIADSLFNPRTDTVDVAGNFNNFDGTRHILTIVPDSDSSIYSITIPGFLDGDHLEFKFRINSSWNDTSVEFPYGQPNRIWTIEHDIYSYLCYYNNQGTPFGVPDDKAVDNISLYPNPANHYIFATPVPAEIQKIGIINLMGQTILIRDLNNHGNQVRIGLNELPKGEYILLFYTQKGVAGSKKFIRN